MKQYFQLHKGVVFPGWHHAKGVSQESCRVGGEKTPWKFWSLWNLLIKFKEGCKELLKKMCKHWPHLKLNGAVSWSRAGRKSIKTFKKKKKKSKKKDNICKLLLSLVSPYRSPFFYHGMFALPHWALSPLRDISAAVPYFCHTRCRCFSLATAAQSRVFI